MTTKTDTQAAFEKWLGARADDPSLPHGLMRDAFCAGVEAAPVAAQAQPTIQDSLMVAQDRDAGLADTQRAIIEAAERRGYERAIAECAQDREDAERYRDIRAAVRQIGENQLWTELCVITAKTADVSVPEFDRRIDAARAAKEQP